MPTMMSHIAVPIAATVALGSKRIPPWMLAAGMFASVMPDFDGIGFQLGIPYGTMLGHRGYTHTLGFAILVGLLGMWLAKYWKKPLWLGFTWLALCTWSHPVLDCFTNGGVAIPLYWPFIDTRFFSPWRPVKVSPVDLHQFISQRGKNVLLSELFTIWLPLMSLALLPFLGRYRAQSLQQQFAKHRQANSSHKAT